MLRKKQLVLVAFVAVAGKVAYARAQAYKPDVDEGGYFTPYLPTDYWDGTDSKPTVSQDDQSPSPTGAPAPDPTDEVPTDVDSSEIDSSSPTNTKTASRPSSTPDNKKYTPVTETLSDGTSYQKGSFNSTLRWQSTGVLKHGEPR